MVTESARTYLALASGLTDATREQARGVVRAVVARGGATAEQVAALADEVLEAGRSNRTALTAIVRAELERLLGTVGLATADDVTRLRQRVATLEAAVRQQSPTREAPRTVAGAATSTTRRPTKSAKKAPSEPRKRAAKGASSR
ncbi:MAG: phasin family protein [Mycobacteriales bacterium]|nr:hypothetical protein [Frankia sp.]